MPKSRHKNKKKERPNPPKTSVDYDSFVSGYYAGAEAGVNQALLIVMYALNKQFGFGNVRLERLYNEVTTLAIDINKELLTFESLQNEVDGICKFDVPKLTRVG